MKTMFDVDDVIEFTVRGRIEEYTVTSRRDGSDDYYVITIPNNPVKSRLYISSKELEAMGAKKVADHEK
jgi:small-conductance mechanosensitive channel